MRCPADGGGDVVLWHNQLRDLSVEFRHKANLCVKVEAGSALTLTFLGLAPLML